MNEPSLNVIVGPMFSGKTSALLDKIESERLKGRSVTVFKPSFDDRYSTDSVVTHDGKGVPAVNVSSPVQILTYFEKCPTDIIAIDEAQFLEADGVFGLISTVERLLKFNVEIIVAGLDLDSRGAGFGPMPALLALADDVLKLRAICEKCGSPARRTEYMASSHKDQIELGGSEKYEARCLKHWSGI